MYSDVGTLVLIRPTQTFYERIKIAFQTLRDGNYEIYVMNVDGTGQTNLTNNPSHDITPDWSPGVVP